MVLKIDSHHHLWDLEQNSREWLKSDGLQKINRTFLFRDFLIAQAKLGIDYSILVQTIPDYAELDEFFQIANTEQKIAGVVSWIDISDSNALAQLDRAIVKHQFKKLVGIRDGAQGRSDKDWLSSTSVISGVQKLGERELVFDLLISPENLKAAEILVRACPETIFVLDHVAKPNIALQLFEPWSTDLEGLAKLPNVYCKVSGMITESNWGEWKANDFDLYFARVHEVFGSDRIMFGSDWPVCLLAGSYEAVFSLAANFISKLSIHEQELFWSGNAIKAYNLKLERGAHEQL